MLEQEEIKRIFQNAEIEYEIGDIEGRVLKRITKHNEKMKKVKAFRLIGQIGFGVSIALGLVYTLFVAKGENDNWTQDLYPSLAAALILLAIAIQSEFIPKIKSTKP